MINLFRALLFIILLCDACEVYAQPDLMEMSLEDLMNVQVTTVSRQESTIGQSAAAIFVITPEMIRRSGATTIPELFRMVPGINVARIDNNKWAIGARGFSERFAGKVLVQLDGRTVYTPIFSGVYWDTVDYPLEDIESIEVIRGPGASVWGANAMNGIINIKTKNAKNTQGGLISGGTGTQERGFGTFRYGGKAAQNLYYRFYGKGFDREKQLSLVDDPNDGWQSMNGGLRLDWEPSLDNALTFDLGYLHSDSGRNDTRPMSSAPFAFRNLEDEVSELGHLLGRWRHDVDEDSSWEFQFYADHVQRDSVHGFLHQKVDIFDGDFQYHFPVGERQKLIYGFGYRLLLGSLGESSWDDGFALNYGTRRRQAQKLSTFLQDEITLLPETLTFTLGSKLEHNDFTGIEIQPTARLMWTPTKKQTFWGAISRAVRTPNLSEDGLAVTLLQTTAGVGNFPQVRGNVDFDSEEVLAHELGYRMQVTENLSTDLAVFYNDYSELKANETQAAEPPLLPIIPKNLMDAETYGVEWSNSWQAMKKWRLSAAYTFLKINLKRITGVPASAEVPEQQSPQHQLYFQSSWDLPHNMEFDLIGRHVSQLGGFNPSALPGVENYIPAYVSLDVRWEWKPKGNWKWEIVGQNLLDKSHPEFGTSVLLRAPIVEIRWGVYTKITYQW